MFIIDLKYTASMALIDKFLVAHRLWLDQLYAANKLLCSGPKNPRNGGVIIALAKNLAELEEILHTDPFYIN